MGHSIGSSPNPRADGPPPNPYLSAIPERIELTAFTPDAGRRLDQFLTAKLPWRSRTGIQKLLSEGRVFVAWPETPQIEEKADKPAARLRYGAKVIVLTPVPRIPPPRIWPSWRRASRPSMRTRGSFASTSRRG